MKDLNVTLPVHGIRVLAVSNIYPTDVSPGNPSIKEQLIALQTMGIKIDLLIIETSNKRSYLKAAWNLFCLTFQGPRYDLIHAYYGLCGFLVRLQFKYPIIVTFLGSDLICKRDNHNIKSRDSIIGRIAAALADVVIVMSEEMKRVTKRQDVLIIPFGIDFNIFAPCPKEQARLELGIPMDEKLILFPWKPDRPEKRFDIIEKSVQLLQDCYDKLHLITIYNKAHERVAKYMNACDVMVMASEHEGSPVSVREAMACNLPIVSVDVGDVANIIEGIDGCFLAQRNPEDFALKLQQVFDRNQRTNGRLKMIYLDVAWSARRVLDVYQHIIQRKTRRKIT
jgi:glycosyltransferase involved in cell wall biosynthesis